MMLPFDVLGRAATFLVESSWIKTLHDEYKVSGAAGFLAGMMNCRVRHQQGEHQSLDLLLASTRRFKATKPVEKIFALMNLAESQGPKPFPPLLRPDYRKPVVEVFRDVTLHLINQGSLDILSGIEDARFRHFRQLPSRVPDYSVHQVISILCMPPQSGHLTLYAAAAAGQNVGDQYSPASPTTLVLSSYRFDEVQRIAPLADQAGQLKLENWGSMLGFGAQYSSASGEPGTVVDAFWRTLIGNIGLGTTDYRSFESTMHHISWFRRLFVTKAGYIGLAHPLRPGHVVVLFFFFGGCVPFIVRKENAGDSEYYHVVGEAYIHGIMDGEPLSTIGAE